MTIISPLFSVSKYQTALSLYLNMFRMGISSKAVIDELSSKSFQLKLSRVNIQSRSETVFIILCYPSELQCSYSNSSHMIVPKSHISL